MASASNHAYWPEMYTNQPIVSDQGFVPYTDTPKPRVFANVSPLDPQLFSTISEHADDLLAGRANAKYSPAEVAAWLDDLLFQTDHALTDIDPPHDAATRRLVEDAAIQSGIAHFFAAKLRAGLYFTLWQKAKSRDAGARAVESYNQARDAWSKMAVRAKSVYATDVSYGEIPQRRGHWTDRLAAIDADLAAMKMAVAAQPGGDDGAGLLAAIAQPPQRLMTQAHHVPVDHFAPGADLPLVLNGAGDVTARLFYRHVNHGERWRSMAMSQEGDSFRAAIPGAYTNSPYPLQYYFVLEKGAQSALYPGFNATLSNQPYFAVWKRG
jgi:hypothetical protein